MSLFGIANITFSCYNIAILSSLETSSDLDVQLIEHLNHWESQQPQQQGEVMRILVIEDSEKHLADAMQYAGTLTGCSVDYVTTLSAALDMLQKTAYDGAICDVFFPTEIGGPVDSFVNAIELSKKLVEMGIHHVFNTSGNHHGRKYAGFTWVTPRATYSDNPEDKGKCYDFRATGMIIEAYPDNSNADKDTKQWQAAFRYILLVLALLQLTDKGVKVIEDADLRGFPYGDYGRLTKDFEQCSHPFVLKTFRQFNA